MDKLLGKKFNRIFIEKRTIKISKMNECMIELRKKSVKYKVKMCNSLINDYCCI